MFCLLQLGLKVHKEDKMTTDIKKKNINCLCITSASSGHPISSRILDV